MAMVVEQNQLFVLSVSKRRDVKRPVGIHQDDLVIGKGRCGTEGRQGIVAARTEGHLGFMMEQESQFFLEGSSLSNAVVFWVLVQAGFDSDEGPSTTEGIVILDADDRAGILCYCLKCGMAWFVLASSAGSLRCMMGLSNG